MPLAGAGALKANNYLDRAYKTKIHVCTCRYEMQTCHSNHSNEVSSPGGQWWKFCSLQIVFGLLDIVHGH